MPTERKHKKAPASQTGPRDWNERQSKPPVFQWVLLTTLLAILAYLFAAL